MAFKGFEGNQRREPKGTFKSKKRENYGIKKGT